MYLHGGFCNTFLSVRAYEFATNVYDWFKKETKRKKKKILWISAVPASTHRSTESMVPTSQNNSSSVRMSRDVTVVKQVPYLIARVALRCSHWIRLVLIPYDRVAGPKFRYMRRYYKLILWNGEESGFELPVNHIRANK